jgi:hypothetical protein
MSLGSPRRTMRFPEELVKDIEQAILSANARRADVPYDWTGWVLQAVREKLAHLARARKGKNRRQGKLPKMVALPITF